MSKSLLFVFVLAFAIGGCAKKHDNAPTPSGSAGSSAGNGSAGSSAGGSGASDSAGSGSGSAGSGAGSGSAAEIPPYTPAADVPAPIRDAVTAADRSDDDRKLDAGRKPAEVLAFFKLAPGQKIGELFAGGGYTSEVMARIVGDKGTIYAQNTKEVLDRFARKPWSERATKPVMKHVVAVERPTDDPFPAEAKKLDAVITILNYHDFVWQKADRAKLNKAVFAALKKGGVYGIVDHSAAPGSGTRDCETLHRIDEEVVKQEVQAAGFKLDAESDLLRRPDDKRDWNSSPKAAGEKRGTSDRFTLRFVKP
ncbi:MAG TPA: SAM-dependent methyltransferase [Kofleriaceae bacterium]|nr:SAM-dependent methyltransferase [Kofleriaceae bacterium]